MVINFYFFLKKTYDRYFLPAYTTKPPDLKPPPVLKSRTNNPLKINEINSSLIDKLIVIQTMFLHHTQRKLRYSMKMRFAPIQLLRWTGDESAAGLIFQRWYLSFILASGTYQSIVPTEFRLMLLPLPLQLQSQDSIRANHRRQCKKRRSSWVVWVHRTVLQW